jgi:hypothetical protein
LKENERKAATAEIEKFKEKAKVIKIKEETDIPAVRFKTVRNKIIFLRI